MLGKQLKPAIAHTAGFCTAWGLSDMERRNRLRKRRQEPGQFDNHRLTGRIDNIGTAE
jgi:hypothetical protein